MSSKTAPLQNHSSLSKKGEKLYYHHACLQEASQALQYLVFTMQPLQPLIPLLKCFHHTLIAVYFNFSLSISSSNSFGFLTVPKVRLAPQACRNISEKVCTLTASFVAGHLASCVPVLCWKLPAGFTPLTWWVLPSSSAGEPVGTIMFLHEQI